MDPRTHPIWLNSVIYCFTTLLEFIFPLFSLCDLDVIIPIGRGGLCETSMRHEQPRNSIRHWTQEKSLVFKFHYCFKFIYCFPSCFKYICRFIPLFTTLWILSNSPPFSFVIWAWKSRLVVVDYVRPQWGINNHIIP